MQPPARLPKCRPISIHAPREGSDISFSTIAQFYGYFYPRSPRGERRSRCCSSSASSRFLSTLPARGATPTLVRMLPAATISIHAPREGSDELIFCNHRTDQISIHAPREGSDGQRSRFQRVMPISIHAPREGSDFPCGATLFPASGISIHAPREGSDLLPTGNCGLMQNFYPRSPRGERPRKADVYLADEKFLSTLPARGATFDPHFLLVIIAQFLSTLPARGATDQSLVHLSLGHYFYPRSPRGERPAGQGCRGGSAIFLSTLPARGATGSCQDIFS